MRSRSFRTSDIPAQACASCGHPFNAATATPGTATPADSVPKPGDLTLCFGCGKAYQFGDGLAMVPVDLDALPMKPEHRSAIRQLQATIVEMMGRPS